MANRYWVGGTGNWSDAANHWSDSSGGSPNASFLPTTADDVFFNDSSAAGTFTVTLDVTASMKSYDASGITLAARKMTLAGTGSMAVYGSWTNPTSTYYARTSNSYITFYGSGTITTNGISLTASRDVTINASGTYTLGSALSFDTTLSAGAALGILAGTFDTGGYNVSLGYLYSTGNTARTINLNNSVFSFNWGQITYSGSNLTLNNGTSIMSFDRLWNGTADSIQSGGYTLGNVRHFGVTILDNTTVNDFTCRAVASPSIILATYLSANLTIQGTFTGNSGGSVTARTFFISDTLGTARTITLNGTLAALADADFRDITVAGTAGTWTGTRLGDCKGNTNITFDAPKVVYWNLAGSQNWSATGWATTNNGAPAANNFPLAQDTATFTEAGAAGTVTVNTGWNIGNIQMADGVSSRTTAFTLATSTTTFAIYGNVTLFSSLTLSGTGTLSFAGRGVTQTITSAGITFTQPITVNALTGTFKLADNFTTSSATAFTLTSGTLDINGKTLTSVLFASNNSNTRVIAFGAGKISLTGNNATIWNCTTATGLTYTGTPSVESTYAGSTGTRTIVHGTTGGTETNAVSFAITAGTDTVATTATSNFKNLIFTGFTGTLTNTARNIYGNLTVDAGMTLTAGANATTFAATSGTQTITTNSKTFDFPLTVNASGATVTFADALTQGSTRAFTFTNGTLKFKNGVTSTVGTFSTSGTNTKYLQSGSAGAQATLSQASGTNNIQYVQVKDIVATGGASWNAVNGSLNYGNNTGWFFAHQQRNLAPALPTIQNIFTTYRPDDRGF